MTPAQEVNANIIGSTTSSEKNSIFCFLLLKFKACTYNNIIPASPEEEIRTPNPYGKAV